MLSEHIRGAFHNPPAVSIFLKVFRTLAQNALPNFSLNSSIIAWHFGPSDSVWCAFVSISATDRANPAADRTADTSAPVPPPKPPNAQALFVDSQAVFVVCRTNNRFRAVIAFSDSTLFALLLSIISTPLQHTHKLIFPIISRHQAPALRSLLPASSPATT